MKAAQANLLVVGSVNLDLVTRVAHLPCPGETVAGDGLERIAGGKGANQAVAAARLGAVTRMVGRVGDDGFGADLLAALRADGVDTTAVTVTPACPSGTALIGVDQNGQNAITIIAGANGLLTPADVRAQEHLFREADAVLLQLEIPLDTVMAAAALGRAHGALTCLDTAPAPHEGLPDALYDMDLISPNQHEAEALTGAAVHTPGDAAQAVTVFRARGARDVVIKLGDQGAYVAVGDVAAHVPAVPVDPVDTTAAGDAFTAALALALAEGRDPIAAARFACAAGTLATLTPGAQPALPGRIAVEDFLSQHAHNDPGEDLP